MTDKSTGTKRKILGPGTSHMQAEGGVATSSEEQLVILNPPRSNTKGRKKGRIPSGIELQAKKTSLCSACGEPGHNIATYTVGLGNR
jgi:hypothetical protein